MFEVGGKVVDKDKLEQFLANGGKIKKIPTGARTVTNKETGEKEVIIMEEQFDSTIKPTTQTARIYSLKDGEQFFSDFNKKKSPMKVDLSGIIISDLPEELRHDALEIVNAAKRKPS